jgi:methionyl aminopeptidase
MIELKTPSEIESIAYTGSQVKEILQLCRQASNPGVNLLELDELVEREISQRGGVSVYFDYAPGFSRGKPFEHYICTSVNDAVLHGRPFDYTLKSGDLLKLDLAFSVDGWVADSAISFVVGDSDSKKVGTSVDYKLIEATQAALAAGIGQAKAGKRIGDVSFAIGSVARKFGLPDPNTTYGGHGVGRSMHEDPAVPNDGTPKTRELLQPGMVIAIEPWFMLTTNRLKTDPDAWTLRSWDGSKTAHFEHTIAITERGARILT